MKLLWQVHRDVLPFSPTILALRTFAFPELQNENKGRIGLPDRERTIRAKIVGMNLQPPKLHGHFLVEPESDAG